MYLLDASSIVNLIRRGSIRPLIEGVTLDLALYESLNAVWKEHRLLKRFDRKITSEFLGIISDVFSVIKIASIKGFEEGVFNLALKEKVTIYDASYMYIAMKGGLILVTDDRKLKDRASKYLKVISTSELVSS